MVAPGREHEAFRRQVDDAILVLFALVSESIGWATTALLEQDVKRAQQVIDADQGIDERCDDLAASLKERLSSGVTDPDELEYLVAVLQLVPELERSADLAEHVAQRTIGHVGGMISDNSRWIIQSMGNTAVRMWQIAGTGYRQRSRDTSFQLTEADDELDELATSLVNAGVAEGVEPQVAVDLALIARFFERLGDHAVNLARRVDQMDAPRRLAGPRVLERRRAARQPPVPDEKRGVVRRFLHLFSNVKLVPTDDGFFDLFQAAGANARDCAVELRKLATSSDLLDEHFEEIKAFERRGDELTVDLLRRLDASFVTPFDREDIHALTEEIDDVVDDLFAAASLLQLSPDGARPPELGELADVLVTMTDEMVSLLETLQTKKGARHRLERIEHLERQGDAVYRRTLERLFSGEYEAIDVIRWKDTAQSLEAAINAIEDVGDVVESILVKES
jgi:predicted phosphate transport protein (TIGR00153 family)